jgi:hypothetical protein
MLNMATDVCGRIQPKAHPGCLLFEVTPKSHGDCDAAGKECGMLSDRTVVRLGAMAGRVTH